MYKKIYLCYGCIAKKLRCMWIEDECMASIKKFGWAFFALSLFAVSGWSETTFGKTVFPLRFYSIANPADSAEQLETWNLLVKYKLFATGLSDGTGLVFKGQNIFITDTVGYSGSATGNFRMGGNSNHALGGPVLFGGSFQNETGRDTLMTGPVRFKGSFAPSSNGKGSNRFRGNYCLDGGFNENAQAGLANGNGKVLTAAECANGDIVPLVETTLDVPEIDRDFLKTVQYHPGISANGKKAYIFVPPYSATDSASFNYFVQSIFFGNNGSLVVVMPPAGRLTKVFVKNSISGLGSTGGTDITVAVAESLDDWNAQDSTWNTAKITPVENANYQGNLLFYTPNDLSMGAGQKHVQGTFISGGSIQIAQHTDFAGQFLAKSIFIDADFSAKDFRYVPFDPPLLDIDPTALASGKFLENDKAQEVPIRLSVSPITDVSFNYCFVLSSEANANAKKLANKADFNLSGMPVCTVSNGIVSGDSGVVSFKKGKILPTNSVKVTPVTDGIVEGDESFRMYVFNMSGAVLSGNKREGYFTLYVKDADDNVPPEFDQASYGFTVLENSPVGTLVEKVHAMDKNVGDVVRYRVASGDSDIFALDSVTGEITVKKAVLDYESGDTLYTLKVYATDGALNSKTVTVKIRVLDVNEAPTAFDTTFFVREDALPGTEIGTVSGFDPDSLNPNFSTLSYRIVSDSSGLFQIDAATGTVSLKKGKVLDYEKDSLYTICVKVEDPGGLSDSATVTVKVLDVNEAPTVSDAVLTIPEDCNSCAATGKISASDPEGDKLLFRIVSDSSGLFQIDAATGTVSLKKGKVLDYEKDSLYTICVKVEDPDGLSDTATVKIKVLNQVEAVKITHAESGDSSWKDPDTVYTNNSTIYVKWTTPAGEKDSTISLVEGKNVIRVRYQDGSDSLVVFLGTKIPSVVISASNDSTGRPSGVTIVEPKDAGDSASYVRSNFVRITVSATDSSGEKPKTVSYGFKLRLDTAGVTSGNIKRAESTIGKVTLSDVEDLSPSVEVKHSVVGKDRVKVSYEEKTASGTVVTVSYETDASGKRLLNENGDPYYEVSYTYTDASGKRVTLTYTVDASGTVACDSNGETIYTVSYVEKNVSGAGSANMGEVTISYKINSAGEKLLDADGNMNYTVGYAYTDSYGNSATASTLVIVDTVPPSVKILSPENLATLSNVSVEVRWTVNDIEQDTLNCQGLNEGKNLIIRTYRDKAGNEASDTVVVILKAGKLITVKVENPLVAPDRKTVDKFVSASNSEDGTSYALSVRNAKTGLEEETQVGSKNGKKEGSHKEPYEGMSGKHLGVTLGISAQAPAIDETGTLSTLESILENGYVALDSGGGWDRTTTTVEDFVENYCSLNFREEYLTKGSSASLYSTVIKIRIWLFTTLGDFVDEYSFAQEITPDYVDKTGGIQMYFELKPDGDGFLKNSDGRLLGSGAYIYKTEVKIRSELRCDLPDAKRGFVRKGDDRILSKWGYRRPKN